MCFYGANVLLQGQKVNLRGGWQKLFEKNGLRHMCVS